MPSHARAVLAAAVLLLAAPAAASDPHGQRPPAGPKADASKPRCEHGVQKALCTRCNPKLVPVFKAKGDWCAEHERPESQCALCHPDLARAGVK